MCCVPFVVLKPGSLTVEIYSKFCVDPYPKLDFHEKSRVVRFSIAGYGNVAKYNNIIITLP